MAAIRRNGVSNAAPCPIWMGLPEPQPGDPFHLNRTQSHGDVCVTRTEIQRLQTYLRNTFGNPAIKLDSQVRPDGSVEVMLGDEFLGVMYKDEEDGEISYAFQMAILEMDLPEAASNGGRKSA